MRSVEETFSRVLGEKVKGDRERIENVKGGGTGEKTSHSSFIYFFLLFFFLIMTHVYNTKYLDQKQGCRDTKSTFIAGHKDK